MKPRGFTLIEVVMALAIVGAMLAVMFGGLRVGVAAWRQGDARAEVLQHLRSLNQVVTETLGGTHPYRTGAVGTAATRLLFVGEPDRIAFVTTRPPVPFASPIAFAAVVLARDVSGLHVLQTALPARDPFERLTPVLTDDTVTDLRLRYLRPDGGWEPHWDGRREPTLPAAVEVTLRTARSDRQEAHAPIVIALRVLTP